MDWKTIVEIRDFSFAYPGKPPVLTIPHLDLGGPGLTAIVGRSGAGKSSLLTLIAALDQRSYKGSLKVFGQEWKALARGRDASRQRHRRRIGLIPQDYGLLPEWTVKRTLEQDLKDADVPRGEIAHRVAGALQEMGVDKHRDVIIRRLSGGQKQRVAIARMLARRVPLIVADEPTANLDEETKRDVIAALRRAGRNALVLIVTHDHWVANQCNDIVMLKESELPAYFGRPSSVSITSKEPGHLETWRFGVDTSLKHQWKWWNEGWSHWDDMDPPRSDVQVTRLTGGYARGTSNHEILAVDSDGRAWRRRWVDPVWQQWVADDPNKDRGIRSVSMTSGGPSDREWWATLDDGQIVHKWIVDGGESEWTVMETPQGRLISMLAAGTIDEWKQADLIAVDTQGDTWHRWWDHGWVPWQPLGISNARAVAITSGRPYHLEMWVVTTDGRIRHRWSWDDNRPWSEWWWMDTPDDLPVVSIAGSLQGHWAHDLIVETADGAQWHRWYSDEGWSSWHRM